MDGDDGYQAVPDRTASRRFRSPLSWACLLTCAVAAVILRQVGATWWMVIPLALAYAVSMESVRRHVDRKTD